MFGEAKDEMLREVLRVAHRTDARWGHNAQFVAHWIERNAARTLANNARRPLRPLPNRPCFVSVLS
jgi:hypothetical protein